MILSGEESKVFEKLRHGWRVREIMADLRQKSANAQGQSHFQHVAFGQELEAGILEVQKLATSMSDSQIRDLREELDVMRRGVELASSYIENDIRDKCAKVKVAINKGDVSGAHALLVELEKLPLEYKKKVDLESLHAALEEKRQQLERSRASEDDAK